MREIRLYGSEGGAAQLNAPSLPLSSSGTSLVSGLRLSAVRAAPRPRPFTVLWALLGALTAHPPLHALCASGARPPARFYTRHCDH